MSEEKEKNLVDTPQPEQAITPLQVLVDAGFVIKKGQPRLSSQAREKTKLFLEQNKGGRYSDVPYWEVIKNSEEILKGELVKQPNYVLLTLLTWLSYNHVIDVLQGRINEAEDVDWLLFWTADGRYCINDLQADILHPTNTKKNLIKALSSCFDYNPQGVAEGLTVIVKMFTKVFFVNDQLATPKRLENFYCANLKWKMYWLPIQDYATKFHPEKDIKKLSKYLLEITRGMFGEVSYQFISLAIKTMDFRFNTEPKEQMKLDALLSSWRNLVTQDKEFLYSYKQTHLLEKATQKVCNTCKPEGELEIIYAIDKKTKFQLDTNSRVKAYEKIGESYTKTTIIEINPSKPQVFTLTGKELNCLDDIVWFSRTSKTQAIAWCIDFALKAIKKPKKELVKTTHCLSERHNCHRTSIRLSMEAIQQLNELTRKLNEKNLVTNRKISKAAAAGWAIIQYAEEELNLATSERSIPTFRQAAGKKRKRAPGQDIRPNDGYTKLINIKKQNRREEPIH